MKFVVVFYMCGVSGSQSERFATLKEAQSFMKGLSINDNCECYNLKRL